MKWATKIIGLDWIMRKLRVGSLGRSWHSTSPSAFWQASKPFLDFSFWGLRPQAPSRGSAPCIPLGAVPPNPRIWGPSTQTSISRHLPSIPGSATEMLDVRVSLCTQFRNNKLIPECRHISDIYPYNFVFVLYASVCSTLRQGRVNTWICSNVNVQHGLLAAK